MEGYPALLLKAFMIGLTPITAYQHLWLTDLERINCFFDLKSRQGIGNLVIVGYWMSCNNPLRPLDHERTMSQLDWI